MKIGNGKVCVHCKAELPITEFNAHATTRDRRQTWCKGCKNKNLRGRRRNNIVLFREKEASLARQYRKTPGGIYQQLKFNAKKKGVGFNFAREEFIGWFVAQPKSCYYCEKSFNGKRGNNFGALSIDRRDSAASYSKGNVVLACRRCNTVKGYWFTEGEMLGIAVKYLRGTHND